VQKSYHPLVRAKELAGTLSSLTKYPFNFTPHVNPEDLERFNRSHTFWSSAQLETTPTLRQMGLYTLHTRGFKVLVKQIRVYVRRWLTPILPYRKD
jgi:hypothetical protein